MKGAGATTCWTGAVALGADVAVMYVKWQQAQKVADAAALAGANYLAGGITYADSTTGTAYPTASGCNGESSGTTSAEIATQVACTYAVNNGLPASTVTISEPASEIKVVATETGLPYFLREDAGNEHIQCIGRCGRAGPRACRHR